MLPLSENLTCFVLNRLYLLLVFCCKTMSLFDYKWGRACTAACESTRAIYMCKYIYVLITTFYGETSRVKHVSFLLQVCIRSSRNYHLWRHDHTCRNAVWGSELDIRYFQRYVRVFSFVWVHSVICMKNCVKCSAWICDKEFSEHGRNGAVACRMICWQPVVTECRSNSYWVYKRHGKYIGRLDTRTDVNERKTWRRIFLLGVWPLVMKKCKCALNLWCLSL